MFRMHVNAEPWSTDAGALVLSRRRIQACSCARGTAAPGPPVGAWPRRNPAHADVFVSCSGDCSVKVWDARQPGPTLSIPAHRYEARRGPAWPCWHVLSSPKPSSS